MHTEMQLTSYELCKLSVQNTKHTIKMRLDDPRVSSTLFFFKWLSNREIILQSIII